MTRHPALTEEKLRAAEKKKVPDVIGPGLRVLFCGINPGLYSAAIGHHFGRPGNRFWKTLFSAGFTPRLLSPYEDRTLLDYGIGVVNLVGRPSAAADELTDKELKTGKTSLLKKINLYHPGAVAVLGIAAYRTAFDRPKAQFGRQPEMIGETALWVLPNPSGLNAGYQLDDLTRLFKALRDTA